MTTYKGNTIGLGYNADTAKWEFQNIAQDFIDPNAFSTPDPKFPTAPTTPTTPTPTEPEQDPCPAGYVYDETLKQCVPDPNYQNPFKQDNNQGTGTEQPFQPGTGVELPKGVNYDSNSLFPYSTDAPTRAQQNEYMLLQSGISFGWLQPNGQGQYVKAPFNEKQGEGMGWAGMAMKYFNEKSYNDYFKILENGWQPEGKGLWNTFLRGNSVYSLKPDENGQFMKYSVNDRFNRLDEDFVYDFSTEFKKKITQAQSIDGGMIDRDGNVNINADNKGGYYREDGKFVLNNGQVVAFGSLSAGLNYVSKLQESGLKLSKTLRDRLAKGIDSVNFNPNMLPEGFTKESLKNIINTYKQEKQTQTDVDLGIISDDGSTDADVSDVGDNVITDVSGDASDDGSTYTPPGTTDEADVTYGGGTDSSGQGSYGGGEDFGGGSTTSSPPTGFGNPGDAGGSTSSGSSSSGSSSSGNNYPNTPPPGYTPKPRPTGPSGSFKG